MKARIYKVNNTNLTINAFDNKYYTKKQFEKIKKQHIKKSINDGEYTHTLIFGTSEKERIKKSIIKQPHKKVTTKISKDDYGREKLFYRSLKYNTQLLEHFGYNVDIWGNIRNVDYERG